MRSVFEAALELVRHGISVIPIQQGTKHPPEEFRWKSYQKRIATEDELRQWFEGTDHGLAVVAGRVSGNLIIRDFDKVGAFARFQSRHPELCRQLPMVQTGRDGGIHLYARGTSTPFKKFADGELRGEGHYCLCPPALHPDGRSYMWLQGLDRLPPTVDPQIFIDDAPKLRSTRRPQRAKGSAAGVSVQDFPSSLPHPLPLCAKEQPEFWAQVVVTLPLQYGQRHERLLQLVRVLRSEYPHGSLRDWEPIVREWHRLARPHIRTKEFKTTWREFQEAFRAWRMGGWRFRWEDVRRKLQRQSIPRWARQLGGKGQQLARLVQVLSDLHGEQPFPLSGRLVARTLPLSSRTAARELNVLRSLGFLTLDQSYPWWKRRAREYRLTVPPNSDQCPEERDVTT